MRSVRNIRLGTSGPDVSTVCIGTSPLGGMPQAYGYDVDAARGIETVRRFLGSSMNFLDTSNEYSDGESERRIGAALRDADTVRSDLVIASKADPKRGDSEFSGERVRQSFRESCARLGVDRLPVYYLHDPERFDFKHLTARGGAVDAMVELKAEGLVDVIGVAGGAIPEMHRYIELGVFDIVLNHNQYTLLDQSAEPLIAHTIEAGAVFVNAAPYASGMLAKAPTSRPHYQYRLPAASIVEKTRWLHEVCQSFGVPLAAVALQFSSRDPRIASTVVGVSAPERIDEIEANESLEIPQELWDLVRERFQLNL